VTVYPQRRCMRLHKWGGVHRFFGRRPGLGAKLVLLSGQTSAFAAGRASHNGATCTAYFCGRPDLGAKLMLLSGQALRIRRGSRLPQWCRVHCIFFCGRPDPWRSLCCLADRTSAFAAGRASHSGAACTAYFLWEARPRGEACAFERADLRFRRGSRLPQWCRVHCIFSVGGPTSGRSFFWVRAGTFAAGAPPTMGSCFIERTTRHSLTKGA